MTKSQAQQKHAELMAEVNREKAEAPEGEDITLGRFLEEVWLPFMKGKWKRSTAATNESRVRFHLGDLWNILLSRLDLNRLQEFLNRKAATRSRSVVSHLRWDLASIFDLALAEGHVLRNPTSKLYVSREAVQKPTRVMTREEVEQYINGLDPREQTVACLAVFAGMRPGEALGLQRKHVSSDCREAHIAQRVYRGDIDTPKTASSERTVAIPPRTAALLKSWLDSVPNHPEAWVFGSENPRKPIWRDNLWERNMKPKLKQLGLAWATFQVLRRTHASLGHEIGLDPKAAADQRGHGIGVSLSVYTKVGVKKRAEAAEELERSVFAA